ncbi:GNAT family N-acetyltransferase [uncultured Clostridium sp.]|uniref:GNAT family N-acetyltransferase n=1 Tax=uncultured Clostridium sp. TaxID=59620 RepID=UPI0026109A9C|nr:GNAT family N-acetyltransferase [uncultured Clostridium sp.]
MIIERLKIEDIPKLIKLYKELVNRETDLDIACNKYNEILKDENQCILVAKENDEIIGTLMGVVCKSLALDGKPFLVVEDVIVNPNLRGKGIGKTLVEEIDKFAISKDCLYAIVVSSGFRKFSHIFYEKVGFDEDVVGFRKSYVELNLLAKN